MDFSSYYSLFAQSAGECLDQMKKNYTLWQTTVNEPEKTAAVTELHRMAHTLKSQCAFMGHSTTSQYCLTLEKIYSFIMQQHPVLKTDQQAAINNSLTILTDDLATIINNHTEKDLTNERQSLTNLFPFL